MCGISFIFNPLYSYDFLRIKMCASLDAMKHRGPDDEGIWCGENVAIGHRRLSIIDLSASRQPMVDQTGRFILTFNGEIYNYKELREDLEKIWKFKTSGDTEVLLAGLVEYGPSFIEKMEGMWAFALWDDKQKEVLLCRDRMGKKPLYYKGDKNQFISASELPGMARLSETLWEEDEDSTADYLRYGYYLPGETAYKDVKEVLPGHFLRWSKGSDITTSPYWKLSLEPFKGNKDEAVEKLRHHLIKAVERRLVADVEVGAFLSGGVDSSLVVAIMAKILHVHPKTFTIGFAEKAYDERKYAELVSADCATDHNVRELNEWDREKLIKLIFDNIGQPFADSSLLPTALVSEVAASKVKVALSGDGGDELFSGYQRYQARSILRWYTRLPRSLRKGVETFIRFLPEPMAHHSRSLLKKAHLFQDILDRLESEMPYVAPVLYSQKFYDELLPDLSRKGKKHPDLPEEYELDDIKHMMIADALIYLPQDILLKVDRASMSSSLESRSPFLDRQVMEMAFSLPRCWHRSGFSGKKMLFDCFKDLLPRVIWHRRKQGFGVPIHKWFKSEIGEDFKELLKTVYSPLSRKSVLALYEEHVQGKRDNGHRLWSIYIYLLWKQSRRSSGF
jgi:asparagine synthase (glutamine-hydrolysing)